VFLPLNDEAPLPSRFRPLLTWGLIGLTSAIFVLFQSSALFNLEPAVSIGYGLVPAVFSGSARLEDGLAGVPTALTPVSSIFLHGGWMHLITNMLFLGIFGDNIERALGRAGYLLLYLACGAGAGIAYALAYADSTSPMIGASGAVSAVLGAYLVLHPNVRVFGLLLNIIPVRIPAFWFIGGWFALQVGQMLAGDSTGVAWMAHVAGLVLGAVLMAVARFAVIRRNVGT